MIHISAFPAAIKPTYTGNTVVLFTVCNVEKTTSAYVLPISRPHSVQVKLQLPSGYRQQLAARSSVDIWTTAVLQPGCSPALPAETQHISSSWLEISFYLLILKTQQDMRFILSARPHVTNNTRHCSAQIKTTPLVSGRPQFWMWTLSHVDV